MPLSKSDNLGNENGNPSRTRLFSVFIGATIGFLISACWTALIGPLTDGPPSIVLSFFVYALGLTAAGAVVGAVHRLPELVGLTAAFVALSSLALVVGPPDGWMVVWLIVFGGSGCLCGPVIGVLFRLVRPRVSPSRNRHPGSKVENAVPRAEGKDFPESGLVMAAILVFAVVFSLGGGLIAVGLNHIAPGYHPRKFLLGYRGYPPLLTFRHGVDQGLAAGTLVGTAIAVGLLWFKQLSVHALLRAFALVVVCGAVFGVGGALVGYSVGKWQPSYYRALFGTEWSPVNSVDFGIGLGCSGGLGLGLGLGAFMVLGLAWYRSL
jgi:hypothetical protein